MKTTKEDIKELPVLIRSTGSFLLKGEVGALDNKATPILQSDRVFLPDCDLDWFASLSSKDKGVVFWYSIKMRVELTMGQKQILSNG